VYANSEWKGEQGGMDETMKSMQCGFVVRRKVKPPAFARNMLRQHPTTKIAA